MKIINLLPKDKQEELHYEAVFQSVLRAGIAGVVTLVLVVLLQIGLGVYLTRHESSISDQIEQSKKLSNKEENANLKLLITGINNQLKDYQDLSNAAPLWSKALQFFAVDVPDGIKIVTLSVDTAKRQMDISGYAPTRDQVILLYNKINEDKEHFKDINYPLENVSRATDINFHFSFFVQDKVIYPNGAPVVPVAPAVRTPTAPAEGE